MKLKYLAAPAAALAVASTLYARLPSCHSSNGLPDPTCNRPVQNQSLTVAQLCDDSFTTKSIRPPTSYTTPLKLQKMKQYGITGSPDLVELDHLQPIEDLGDPRDPNNLWPQYWYLNVNGFDEGAHTKDRLENQVHKLLCDGSITPKQVNLCFTDWVTCYKNTFGDLPKFNH
jgi:hypothetical protein